MDDEIFDTEEDGIGQIPEEELTDLEDGSEGDVYTGAVWPNVRIYDSSDLNRYIETHASEAPALAQFQYGITFEEWENSNSEESPLPTVIQTMDLPENVEDSSNLSAETSELDESIFGSQSIQTMDFQSWQDNITDPDPFNHLGGGQAQHTGQMMGLSEEIAEEENEAIAIQNEVDTDQDIS